MQLYNSFIQFTPYDSKSARRVRNVYTMSMTDAPLQQFVEEVEKDLLSHIYAHLKENQLSAENAKKLAHEFLSLLPFSDKKDLLEKLNHLGKDFPEARETYVKYIGPFEEQERQRKLDLMRQHIREGSLEAAIAVAKGGENGSTSAATNSSATS